MTTIAKLKANVSKPSIKVSGAIKNFKNPTFSTKTPNTIKNAIPKPINLGKFTKVKTPKMVALKKAVKNVGF